MSGWGLSLERIGWLVATRLRVGPAGQTLEFGMALLDHNQPLGQPQRNPSATPHATAALSPAESNTPFLANSAAATGVATTGTAAATAANTDSRPRRAQGAENFNFAVMSWHQVLMRTGWIFKTESIVMPAMLDMLGGSAWVRGFLPMLNRFGQSIPPMLAAGYVRGLRQKKLALTVTSILMGVVFLGLGGIWWIKDSLSPTGLTVAILVLYAVFFSSTGVNQLIASTLTGKVIPVFRRGQLMQFSSSVGSIVAVSCAWILLSIWLQPDQGNFAAIFVFAGLLFVVSGFAALLFRETDDVLGNPGFNLRGLVVDSVQTLQEDSNFRLLALIATLFGVMMTLFPHYQDLGRTQLGLGLDSLVLWIVAQNLGVAVFSLPAGWIADRVGNRRVLKWLMAGLCLVPALALVLGASGKAGQVWFFLVFGFLGLTPVTIRTLNNYTLELVDRGRHPKYLAILSLAMAGPALFGSLLVGWFIDLFGYTPTFLAITAFQMVGYFLCFRLIEPRRHRRAQAAAAPMD